MLEKLSQTMNAKYAHKSELKRQIKIAKILEIYRNWLKKKFPQDKKTTPVSLRGRVLMVKTTSAVLASELRLREREIFQKIKESLGEQPIDRIVYRF